MSFGGPAASAVKPAATKLVAPARTAAVPRVGPSAAAATLALNLPPVTPANPAPAQRARGGARALRPRARLTPAPPPVAPAAPARGPTALAAAPSGPHGDDAWHRAHAARAGATPRAPSRAPSRRADPGPEPRALRAARARRRPLRAPAHGLPCGTRHHDGRPLAARAHRRPLRPSARGGPRTHPGARGGGLPSAHRHPAPGARGAAPPPRLSIPDPPPRRPPLPSLLTIGPGRRSLSTFGTIIVSALTATAVVSLALYLFIHRDKGPQRGQRLRQRGTRACRARRCARPRYRRPPRSASASANPADLPFGYGYLTIVSPAKANVYVSGKLAGPVNKPLKVRCGRFFIRLAAPQEGGSTPSGSARARRCWSPARTARGSRWARVRSRDLGDQPRVRRRADSSLPALRLHCVVRPTRRPGHRARPRGTKRRARGRTRRPDRSAAAFSIRATAAAGRRLNRWRSRRSSISRLPSFLPSILPWTLPSRLSISAVVNILSASSRSIWRTSSSRNWAGLVPLVSRIYRRMLASTSRAAGARPSGESMRMRTATGSRPVLQRENHHPAAGRHPAPCPQLRVGLHREIVQQESEAGHVRPERGEKLCVQRRATPRRRRAPSSRSGCGARRWGGSPAASSSAGAGRGGLFHIATR